jgi:hypothetical protein
MNRRTIVLSAALTIALVLGFQTGTLIAPAFASAATPSIDTTPSWDGVQYISSFGMPNTATYGQTITMTESATLTRFSFFIKVSPATVFRGQVFMWDGTKATGTPLFESTPMSTTQGTNFEEVVFSIPCGIVLNGGQQYVLFASTSQDPVQPDSAGAWGAVTTNTVYGGGQFVFLNNGSDPTGWTSTAWSTINQDLAFKATLVRPASIDTTPSWDRVQYISSFGMPNTATYGQTITMTESATLTQFSFFFMTVPSTTIFRGHVFEWDGTRATGTPLFASAPMNTLGAQCQEVVFTIPEGVALNAGHHYVLFASTSQDPGQPDSAGAWGAVTNNTVYGGGQFVYLNNGSDPTRWTSTAWSTINQDLAFKATLQRQVFLPLVLR